MTIYRTTNWGGVEGKDIITRNYATEEAATEAAKKDTWGTGYKLYKVEYKVNENGEIEEEKTLLKELVSGRDMMYTTVEFYMLINKKGIVVHGHVTKEELAKYMEKINKYGWTMLKYTEKIYKG